LSIYERDENMTDFEKDLEHHNDKGPNDLERQIADLKARLTQLTGIEKMHKDLNGMLRQEVYDLKMKVHGQVKLENQIEGQKRIIEELSLDNQRLSKQIDDYVSKLRKNGVI
tara:strand:- start:475 stop:810 length:336 start_codon:yes stop_codon:yes gene_type:complete